MKPTKFDADAGALVTGEEALEWFKVEVRNWLAKKKG